tara:strand:- start:1046 stop:2737 length:1692 start_codon:yes stop_codon:yes gene_type:complete
MGVNFVFGFSGVIRPEANVAYSGTNFSMIIGIQENQANASNDASDQYANVTIYAGNYTDGEVDWVQAPISGSGNGTDGTCINFVCNLSTSNGSLILLDLDATSLEYGSITHNPGTGLSLVASFIWMNGSIDDDHGTTNHTVANVSFDNTAPSITLQNITVGAEYGDGVNGLYYKGTWFRFNVSSSDPYAFNCSLYHNMNGTWTPNTTVTTANATSTAFTALHHGGLSDGIYTWGARCWDDVVTYVNGTDTYNSPNSAWSSNITFYRDGVDPVFRNTHLFKGQSDQPIWMKDTDMNDDSEKSIKLLNGIYTTEIGEPLTVYCDATDATSGIQTGEYFLKKPGMNSFKKLSTPNCPSSSDQSICKIDSSELIRTGVYQLYCRVSDYMGYEITSPVDGDAFTFRVQAEEEDLGTGGTYVKAFNVDFSKVSEKLLAEPEGRVLSVSFDGVTEHTITFDKVSDAEVTLTIMSNPITVTLKKGEYKNIDINEDGINDFSVTYKGFIMGNAQVEFKSLEGAAIVAEEERPKPTTPTVTPEPTIGVGIWIILGVVAVGLVVYFVLVKRKKK